MSIIGAIPEQQIYPYNEWNTINNTDIFNPTAHELKVGSASEEIYLGTKTVSSNYPLWYFMSNSEQDLYIEKSSFEVENNITAITDNGMKFLRGQKIPGRLSFFGNGAIEFLQFWYRDDSISAPIAKEFTFGLYGQKPVLANLILDDWKVNNFQQIITKNITYEEYPPTDFSIKPPVEDNNEQNNNEYLSNNEIEEYCFTYIKPYIDASENEKDSFFVSNLFNRETENNGLVSFSKESDDIMITLPLNAYSEFITLDGDYKILKRITNTDEDQSSWSSPSVMLIENNEENIHISCVYDSSTQILPYILIGIPK